MTQQRVSPVSITSQLPAITTLSVQGALGQSTSLQRWQDSTGATLVSVAPSGTVTLGGTTVLNSTFGLTALNKSIGLYHTANTTTSVAIMSFARGNSTGSWMSIGQSGDGANGVASIDVVDGNTVKLFSVGQAGNTTINNSSASVISLTLKAAASQTANIQEWQNSAGSARSWINSAGTFLVTGGSYIESSGRAFFNASVASYIPVTIRGTTSQTANLQEWQNVSGTVLTLVNSIGRVTVGSAVDAGGSAMRIDQPNGGTGLSIFGAGTLSTTLSLNPTAAVVGAIIKAAASQTANLQEWQDSTGTVLSNITASGGIETNGNIRFYATSARSGWSTLQNTLGNLSFNYLFTLNGGFQSNAASASTVGAIVKGAASQTADLQQWQNSAGSVITRVDSAGDLSGHASFAVKSRYLLNTGNTGAYLDYNAVSNSFTILQRITTSVNLIVKAVASQTANLQEWQDSAGTIVGSVSPSGSGKFVGGLDLSGGNGTIVGGGGLTCITLGANRNIQLGSATGNYGGGQVVVGISNATTVPTTNPTGGGIIYAEGGALKYRGSSGGVNTIAPDASNGAVLANATISGGSA